MSVVSAADVLSGLLKHSVVVWLLEVRLTLRTAPSPVAQEPSSDGTTPDAARALRRYVPTCGHQRPGAHGDKHRTGNRPPASSH